MTKVKVFFTKKELATLFFGLIALVWVIIDGVLAHF